MSSIHVFLTRPQGRNGSVPARLRASGMEVCELPALELRPLAPAWVPRPDGYDVVVFVSRYAVQRYLRLAAAGAGGPLRWPGGTIAATVGGASARALHESGLIPDDHILHPPGDTLAQDSEALLSVLSARGIAMRRVLIVRGTQGREWLARMLRASGAQVDILPVYERVPAAWHSDTVAVLRRALGEPGRCIFLLTSSEGVHAISRRFRELHLLADWSAAAFVVIHERVGATLQSVLASEAGEGIRRLELCMPDDDSIVEAIQAVARPTAKP